MAGEVKKINVRSPYYLTVDSSVAPTEPEEPTVPFETITQSLGCGEEINVGEDVGTRIYEVDVTNRSGAFRINYTIYRPIKITYQLTEDASPTVVGYRGGDDYEQELIDSGVSSSELTNLASGEFDNSYIEITRTSDEASTLTITVEAPLESDDYRLLMQCPDVTSAPVSAFSLPATPPTNTDLLDGSQTLGMTIRMENPSGFQTLNINMSCDVYINDVLIQTISYTELDITSVTTIPNIIFTGISGLNWASPNTQDDIRNHPPIIVDNSEFIVGNNKIGLEFNWNSNVYGSQIRLRLIEFLRTGIFRNITNNSYEFAWAYYQDTHSWYGFTDIYDTEVRNIANSSSYISNGERYNFLYNTETRNVSKSSSAENDINIFPTGSGTGASGGIYVS